MPEFSNNYTNASGVENISYAWLHTSHVKSYDPVIQSYFNENHWCKADFLNFSTDTREESKTYVVGKNKQISRAKQHMSFLSES